MLKQKDLRAPLPQRPADRAAASPQHHAWVAAHLTRRDRWIARMLAEHRVLTSTQLTQLAFPSRRAANLRLRQLYQWRVVNRFQPFIGRGRAPMFYVLDITGAHVLAHEDGTDPTALKYRPERSIGIAHSIRLAHLHGVNGFFTGLIATARRHPRSRLLAWWPETRCARHFGDIVRPDGYGRWIEHGRTLEWFLEWDTGSYQLQRLAAKLHDYAKLRAITQINTPLLLCFASPHREAHAREILTRQVRETAHADTTPIATTSADRIRHSAAEAVWLPLEPPTPDRCRLADLADRWPHVAVPARSDQQAARIADSGGTATLTPPEPMPPWSSARDLTWHHAPEACRRR
ncbi:hypothetical protein GCM10025762_15240 [Haloechinothrix salitolerans]